MTRFIELEESVSTRRTNSAIAFINLSQLAAELLTILVSSLSERSRSVYYFTANWFLARKSLYRKHFNQAKLCWLKNGN
jgi:hypothetical protein